MNRSLEVPTSSDGKTPQREKDEEDDGLSLHECLTDVDTVVPDDGPSCSSLALNTSTNSSLSENSTAVPSLLDPPFLS